MFSLIIWWYLLIINSLPGSRRNFHEKSNGIEKAISVTWIMLSGIENTKKLLEGNSVCSFISWIKNIRSVQIRKPVNVISPMSLQRIVLSQKPSFCILGKTKSQKTTRYEIGWLLSAHCTRNKAFYGRGITGRNMVVLLSNKIKHSVIYICPSMQW